MKAEEEALGALFKTDVRFVIPRFQRRYVWSLDNWAALWEDVLGAVERYTDPQHVPEHFLGAVVLLSGAAGGPSTMRIRQVIDGQQRLATLQVLFAAARDVAAARRLDRRYLVALRKLTHNDDEMSDDADDVYKLWPTRHDWQPFRTAMAGGLDPAVKSAKDTPTLVLAYDYFARAIRAWATPMSGAELEAAYDRLLAVLNHGLRLVVLDLDQDDNPQVIFESLNGRGMPLQISDLVRNHFFYLADVRKIDAGRLYDEHWLRFEDGFWRDDINKGPRGGTRLDAFLAYFLAMELKRSVHHQQIFLEFRKYLDPQANRLSTVMARFAAYGDIYRALDQRTELTAYEAKVMARIDLLDTAAVMPLLLHVFGEYEPDVRRGILELLESYLIRRVIVGWDAKSYGEVAIALIKRLNAARDPVAAVRDQLAGYRGKTSGWPTDADILRSVRNRSMASTKVERIRLILSIIDAQLRTAMTEKLVHDLSDLTLEHLMPRAWDEHWPLGPATATQRRELIYTLGNLTLITGNLNGKLGNRPWRDKRAAIGAHSRLPLNDDLPAIWDENAIRARGEQFARALTEALPGPSVSGMTEDGPEAEPEAPDSEGETLADELDEASTPAAPLPVLAPPSNDPLTRHVVEVLSQHPRGTRLTPGQLARATSSVTNRPSQKTIADRLKKGTLSGVEATTNRHGHLAARLSRQPVPVEPLSEATTILRAPAGTDQEAAFHVEMVQLYARARDEVGYSANLFLQGVRQRGGVAVAKHLLSQTVESAGFRRLVELNRLDLTVEALVLREEFAPLFSAAERATARERLAAAS
ncbi:MAG: DUF262 domain-containing protein [Betaproteobacteria bacterium]